MTLAHTEIEAVAQRLDQAEQTRVPMRQLSLQYPDMTIDDAYAIQRTWMHAKLEAGRRLIGRKIGLTSRVMQQSLGIAEPDYGALLDDMVFADGADVPVERFIRPRVEVELAFVLGRPLHGPHCTIFDVLRATDYVTPAMEILDSRIQMADPETGHTRTIVDTIADNAADAGIVLGGRPMRPHHVDLRWVSAVLWRDNVIEESGVSAAVLNHPAHAVAWLANKLYAHDVSLEAGQVVMSGSFTRAIAAQPGETFHADYGPLGTVSCRFVGEGAGAGG
jgi:2-oxo-hept-3-ene-1,7-dioate hydratase